MKRKYGAEIKHDIEYQANMEGVILECIDNEIVRREACSMSEPSVPPKTKVRC